MIGGEFARRAGAGTASGARYTARMLRALTTRWRRRRLYARCAAGQALVLRFHSVGEPAQVREYLDPGLSLTPDAFRRWVRFLAQRFEIVRADRIPALRAGPRRPRPAVALTFDDGYRDNHDVALPILREEGVEAAFFVTTGPLSSGRGLWISELWRLVPRLPPGPLELAAAAGPFRATLDPANRTPLRRSLTGWIAALPAADREAALDALADRARVPRGHGLERSFMGPAEVAALARHGMLVGAHTRTHPHLDRLDPAAHAAEVAGSRADLEALLGTPVTAFAYPNPGGAGTRGAAGRAAVEAAGFTFAVTSEAAPVSAATDPLMVPRVGVYAGPQEAALMHVLARR